jgi:alanine racemase
MERAVARIDLGAVERNCARLKAELGADSELCAVVKADGYGHGADACATAALAGGATRLAVATGSEAALIGRRFPQVPLLALGALTAGDLEDALAAGAEIAVWREGFRAFAGARGRAQGRRVRVHVKFDSGMGRLGNPDEGEVLALARACAEDPHLDLAGIWTHFATADEPDSDFFDRQLERFAAVAATIKAEFPEAIAHAANSAAVFRDRRSHFDMARCGVAVYGLDPFQGDPAERGLEPALSLRSYVADIKRFPAGASAGYGQTWRAPAETWVGVLPLGYGDGVRRGLSNNAEVLIRGRRHPLVGTVSMDNVTVDLGAETEIEPGDEAVLIGSQGEESIRAEEVAERLGTINYEVTCGISARVPREPL